MTEPTAPQRAGSFWDGFLIGVRASVQQPGLAIAFVIVTLALAVAQGGLVWLLREVLRRFAAEHGASGLDLALAAGTILGIWIGRAALAYHGEVLSMRIAYHAEVDGMRRVLAKLLTLSPRFFDQNSQGDLIMASYFDLKGVRTVTMDVGNVVLYASRLVGLGAVAYIISPELAFIGLVAVPLGALPAHYFGQRMT
ncbi:MAG TPA: ABC transporter transmembrane domain-containing protein, partial [Gemmatimonadaceae bacterium]|nr:ABC transporter transmembrane domain-containing protein [Gemmatimonadaceae bacterium]